MGSVANPDNNSAFTAEQVARYFDHIGLPKKYQPSLNDDSARDLELLTALHVHQIAAIPYENLSLHYSTKRTLSLRPADLYDKFIAKGPSSRRGGYCMENALFFLHILRFLGFDVYPTGVRIRLRKDGVPSGPFGGLVHIVLIVTFPSSAKYVSDVAFGGDGPTRPYELVDGQVYRNLGSQEIRYVHRPIPDVKARASGARQEFWVYEYRNSVEQEWNPFYCFTEVEYLEPDFDVMNFWTSQGKTLQLVMLLVIKFLKREETGIDEGPGEIAGKLMLVNGVLKRNLGGKTEVVKECRTEAERIEVLKEWFGIELSVEEQKAIRGMTTKLRDAEIVEV